MAGYGPYVEILSDPHGWVWIDADGYGHRGIEYADRWQALGREQSGWNQSLDGSFVSQKPLGVRGQPLDPSLPPPPPPSSGNGLLWVGAAIAALYLMSR